MSSVAEFVSWPASDAYKADQTIIIPTLEILHGAKGAQKIYYGIQHEDQATALLVITMIADKPTYEKLGTTLAPILGGDLHVRHIKFAAPETVPAQLEAPLTEIVNQKIKDTSKAAELDAHLATATDFSAGRGVEDEKQWVLIKGWQNVEEHQAYVKEKLAGFGEVLVGLVDIDMKHYKLTSYAA